MVNEIVNFLLGIPQTIATFGSWLVTPLGNGITLSPLALLGVGGVSVIIGLIGLHIVRLFV